MARQYKGKKVIHKRDGSVTIVTKLGPKQRNRSSVSSGGCFPSSALVLTPSGWKAIVEIQIHDEVLSYCPNSLRLNVRTVTSHLSHESCQIWEIHTNKSKKPICTTAIHPFLSERGWVQTQHMKVGDILISANSHIDGCVVAAIHKTNRIEPAHNLHTTGEHNYIVEGCVAHNFAYFRFIRTLFHGLFIDSAVPRLMPV